MRSDEPSDTRAEEWPHQLRAAPVVIGVVVGCHRVGDVVQESGHGELEVVGRLDPQDGTALEAVREDIDRGFVLECMPARKDGEAFVDRGDRCAHRVPGAHDCAS